MLSDTVSFWRAFSGVLIFNVLYIAGALLERVTAQLTNEYVCKESQSCPVALD